MAFNRNASEKELPQHQVMLSIGDLSVRVNKYSLSYRAMHSDICVLIIIN